MNNYEHGEEYVGTIIAASPVDMSDKAKPKIHVQIRGDQGEGLIKGTIFLTPTDQKLREDGSVLFESSLTQARKLFTAIGGAITTQGVSIGSGGPVRFTVDVSPKNDGNGYWYNATKIRPLAGVTAKQPATQQELAFLLGEYVPAAPSIRNTPPEADMPIDPDDIPF
jgi:hypothetical protein